MIKNTQKGKIPLMKLKYKKEGEIGIYSKKGYDMRDSFLKSLPSKLPFSLGIKYNRYKREGVRLGRGKSKIIGALYKIYKDYKFLSFPLTPKKSKNLSSFIINRNNFVEMKTKLKNIVKRYPYLKIK